MKRISSSLRVLHTLVAGCWLPETPEGPVRIDSGYVLERRLITSQLKAAGLLPGLRAHFITHAHPDHMGNAAFLRREYGTEIVCRDVERPYMNGSLKHSYSDLHYLGPVNSTIFRAVLALTPDDYVDPDVSPKDGEEYLGFKLIAVPGHTPGSTAYLQKSTGTLFVGDSLLGGIPPWIMFKGLALPERAFSYDYPEALRSLRRLCDLDFDVLCCGHGPVFAGGAKRKVMEFLDKKGVL